MIKRTIVFSSPCKVTTKDNQLIAENKDSGEVKKIPIEDLGVVIIEHQMTNISIPVLNALSANNCAVVFCDSRHMPISMLFNLDSNSIQAERYRLQTDASLPLKKNLWKQIIQAKILNQSRLLFELGLDGSKLKPYYMNVKSGDADNREGIAANIYWDSLLGKDFVRSRYGSEPNSLLNYGYAILRAGMTRAIMGSGLFPAFGIFHKNRYNAFPLSDDLMEPYRPYVDQLVIQLIHDGNEQINTQSKQLLLNVMFLDTRFKDVTRPLELALSVTTASLARCLAGESKIIEYPLL